MLVNQWKDFFPQFDNDAFANEEPVGGIKLINERIQIRRPAGNKFWTFSRSYLGITFAISMGDD